MEYKDYYATLCVEKTASADDIKKAYRKLVRKYHPDVSKHKDADAKTKEINEAYDVLGNAEKRAAYDELGRGHHAGEQFRPPPDWASQYDFQGMGGEDFFSDLFAHVGRRSRAGGGGGGARGFQMRGDDIHAAISIDLKDAYHGAARTVTMRVPEQDPQGHVSTRDKTLNVSIPKGVTPGQQLRLAGQGHPGIGGGPPGDLYLEIQFNADPRYRIEGAHVYENVPVAPWEAALGAEVRVPTPAGELELTIPRGSGAGRKLRVRGKGLPSDPPGDLYFVLQIALPPAGTPDLEQAWRTLAERAAGFNPRATLGVPR